MFGLHFDMRFDSGGSGGISGGLFGRKPLKSTKNGGMEAVEAITGFSPHDTRSATRSVVIWLEASTASTTSIFLK